MGVRLMDGFDSYGVVADLDERWATSNSATGLTLVTGRAGDESISPSGQSLQWAAAQVTTELRRSLGYPGFKDNTNPAVSDLYVFGFNVQFASLPSGDTVFFSLGSHGDDSIEGGLAISSTGEIKWIRDSVGSVVHTTTGTLTAGAWHHIELRVDIEDQTATSICEIAIDGSNEDFGGSVRLFGADPVTDLTFGPKVNTVGVFKIDDFYMIDELDGVSPTAKLGESQISTLYPNGDGNTSAWTRFSGATDWESVDEGRGTSHDGDTTYLESQTTGQQSLFTFTNLDGGVTDVDVVAVNMIAKKNGLGGPGLHAAKRTSTTTVVDTGTVQRAAVDTYVSSQKVFETDGLGAVSYTHLTLPTICSV